MTHNSIVKEDDGSFVVSEENLSKLRYEWDEEYQRADKEWQLALNDLIRYRKLPLSFFMNLLANISNIIRLNLANQAKVLLGENRYPDIKVGDTAVHLSPPGPEASLPITYELEYQVPGYSDIWQKFLPTEEQWQFLSQKQIMHKLLLHKIVILRTRNPSVRPSVSKFWDKETGRHKWVSPDGAVYDSNPDPQTFIKVRAVGREPITVYEKSQEGNIGYSGIEGSTHWHQNPELSEEEKQRIIELLEDIERIALHLESAAISGAVEAIDGALLMLHSPENVSTSGDVKKATPVDGRPPAWQVAIMRRKLRKLNRQNCQTPLAKKNNKR